jgi:hypothetical protein
MKLITYFAIAAALFLDCFGTPRIDIRKKTAKDFIQLAQQDVFFLTAVYDQQSSSKQEELDPLIEEGVGNKNIDPEVAHKLGMTILEIANNLEEKPSPLKNPSLSDYGIDLTKLPNPLQSILKKVISEDVTKLSREERIVRLIKDAIVFLNKSGEKADEEVKKAEELLKVAKKELKKAKKAKKSEKKVKNKHNA